jgi:hypothetical protein
LAAVAPNRGGDRLDGVLSRADAGGVRAPTS